MQNKQEIIESKVNDLVAQVQEALNNATPTDFKVNSGFKIPFITTQLHRDLETLFIKKMQDLGWHAWAWIDDGEFKGYRVE